MESNVGFDHISNDRNKLESFYYPHLFKKNKQTQNAFHHKYICQFHTAYSSVVEMLPRNDGEKLDGTEIILLTPKTSVTLSSLISRELQIVIVCGNRARTSDQGFPADCCPYMVLISLRGPCCQA